METEITLAIEQNGEPMANSRDIAAHFEKRHDHVLRDIDALKEHLPSFGEMFIKTEIPDKYNRQQRAYLMNRDGFSLLAMGFTGSRALEWKVKYINAFNSMEKSLKSSSLALPQDYPSALRALADAEEQRLALAAKVEADAPKLETYERLAARDGLTNIRDTAKLLGIPQKRFVNFLIGNGYCYRDKHGRIRPYAGKGDGLFVVKEYANDATGAHGVQTLVTFEGRELFARKLAA